MNETLRDTLLPRRGVSEAAGFVEEATAEGRRSLQRSSALGMESLLREELAEVWEDCRQPGWDGYGALAVSQDVLRNAYVLLESLPLGFPVPSIGAEPDGDLTLEWHRSPVRTLSVSVTPHDDLHYAALIGPNKSHGTEAFFGDCPETILDLIRRVYRA